MAKDVGREILMMVGDGEDPEVFAAIASMTAKTIALNGETITLTDHDSVDGSGRVWAEVTGRGAVSSMSLSGDGRVNDGATLTRLITVFNTADRMVNMQLVVPAQGTFAATFCLTALEFGATDEATFSLSMTSSGAVTFT